jgi:hypothetical protein
MLLKKEMARRHFIDWPFSKHELHIMFFCSKLKWEPCNNV